MARLERMGLRVMFSAPYSWAAAPCELAFSALKLGELNPERLPTGKKSLSNVAQIVEQRLAAIPRSVAIKYWHHATLGHYGYLSYERL